MMSLNRLTRGRLVPSNRRLRCHLGRTKVVELRPIDGFAAETAATVIEGASRLGIPVSTTHVISSSIMGVGATRRASAVRWGVAGRIVAAWVVTIPVCVLLGWAFYSVLHLVTGAE